MYLWKLDSSEHAAFLIAANTEQEARDIAEAACDSSEVGGQQWQHSSCEAVGVTLDVQEAGVILANFNAG